MTSRQDKPEIIEAEIVIDPPAQPLAPWLLIWLLVLAMKLQVDLCVVDMFDAKSPDWFLLIEYQFAIWVRLGLLFGIGIGITWLLKRGGILRSPLWAVVVILALLNLYCALSVSASLMNYGVPAIVSATMTP